MNIDNINEDIEYSNSEIGKSLLSFIRKNDECKFVMNSVISFSEEAKKSWRIPMSGKWKLIGADAKNNSLFIFEKNDKKTLIEFSILSQLNGLGLVKTYNE